MLLVGACIAQETRQTVPLDQLPQAWRDDRGRDLSLSALLGHRVVLTMAYASCHRICPATMEQLKRIQQAADRRSEVIDFVIVGYDPKNDTPAVWHSYRSNRRLMRDNWYFLSGSLVATSQLAHQLGFPFWTYDTHVMHDSRAVLFDSQGVPRASFGSGSAHWDDAL